MTLASITSHLAIGQSGSKRISKMLVIICIIALSVENAKAAYELSVETLADYDFGTWANAGNLTATNTVCVVTWQTVGASKRGITKNYGMKIENTLGSSGLFLYLNGDSSATGNSRIEISMDHADVFEEPTFEALLEGQSESSKQKGQPTGCPNGENSQLRINIASSELTAKTGGDYIGYFQQTIQEGTNVAIAAGSFAVFLTVGGVPEVKISHLDSVDFGQHTGLGDLSANESFCIYSSANNGAYRLSISSSAQDSNGHYLTESSGSDRIPLSISYIASGTATGTTPITNNYVYGNGDSVDTDCQGNNNTTLTFQITEENLQAAPTGTYSEQLTILVEPE